MMNTRAIKHSVFAALMLLPAAAHADIEQHATICKAENSETESFLGHTIWGIHNTTDTDLATVWCPVTFTPEKGAFAHEDFFTSVMIYQRNANVPFTCTFFELNLDGSPHWSWTQTETDPSLSFDGGFVLSVEDTEGWPYVTVWRCTIPPETEDGRFSHVTSLRTDWVIPQ